MRWSVSPRNSQSECCVPLITVQCDHPRKMFQGRKTMALQLGHGDDLQAEINVTPLVDVVLVLLVIFMVVTPVLKQEVPIELPLAENSRETQDLAQLTLMVAADGSVLLNGQYLLREALVTQLRDIYAARVDKTIFLEADRNLSY